MWPARFDVEARVIAKKPLNYNWICSFNIMAIFIPFAAHGGIFLLQNVALKEIWIWDLCYRTTRN